MTTQTRPVITADGCDLEVLINEILRVDWSGPYGPEVSTPCVEIRFELTAKDDMLIPSEISGIFRDTAHPDETVGWTATRGEVVPSNCAPGIVAIVYALETM